MGLPLLLCLACIRKWVLLKYILEAFESTEQSLSCVEKWKLEQRARGAEMLTPILFVVHRVDQITAEHDRLPLLDLVDEYFVRYPRSDSTKYVEAYNGITAALSTLRDFGYLENDYTWGDTEAGRTVVTEALSSS